MPPFCAQSKIIFGLTEGNGGLVQDSGEVIVCSPTETIHELLDDREGEIKGGVWAKIYPLSIWWKQRFGPSTFYDDFQMNYVSFQKVESIVSVRRFVYRLYRDGTTLTSKKIDEAQAKKWLDSLVFLEKMEKRPEDRVLFDSRFAEDFLEMYPRVDKKSLLSLRVFWVDENAFHAFTQIILGLGSKN